MRWVLESEPWKNAGTGALHVRRIATTSCVGGAAEVRFTVHGAPGPALLPGTKVKLKALTDDGYDADMLILEEGGTTSQQTFWATGIQDDGWTIRASAVEPIPAEEATGLIEIHQRDANRESAWDLLRRASADTLTPDIDAADLDPERLAKAVPGGWCVAIPDGAKPEERIAAIERALRSWGYRVANSVRAAGSTCYRLVGTGSVTMVLNDASWGPDPDAPEGVVRLKTERVTKDVHKCVQKILSPYARCILQEGSEGEDDPVAATPERIEIGEQKWRATRASIEVELWSAEGVRNDEERSGKLTATIDLADEMIQRTDFPAPSLTMTGAIVGETKAEGWLSVGPRSEAESRSEDPALDYLDQWISTAEDELLMALETAPGGGRGEYRMMRAEWREGDEVVICLQGNGIPLVMGGIGEAVVGKNDRVVRFRAGEFWIEGGEETKTTWSDEGVNVAGNTKIEGYLDTA